VSSAPSHLVDTTRHAPASRPSGLGAKIVRRRLDRSRTAIGRTKRPDSSVPRRLFGESPMTICGEPLAIGSKVTVPRPFTATDREGCTVLFRPLVQADRPTVVRLFEALSAQSRFHRFNSLYAKLSDKQLTSLFDLDYRDRFAWAVEVTCDRTRVPAALGRYARYPATRHADVALTIADEWQGRGLGGSLLDTLIITAHHHGFVSFDTIVAADNQPMLHLFQERGAELSTATAGSIDVVLPLDAVIKQLVEHPLFRTLSAASRSASSPSHDSTPSIH
jgi:GNAT superfamily N-acetyltransferase